ncbi:MAG: M48 family metallopeptidase [Candidatus Azambacteria bacterium]|nr:M48 family metallopeptidase [Candidatus Azambacteria bacterium]
MATIYSHRDSNIRKTWLLVTLFLVVVIGVGWVFAQIYGNSGILYIAVVFSILMNVAAYWWSDKIVLKMAGAKPVTRENARELYNIVENLSITAGLPVPKIYIVPERQPNAFATGRNPKHAALAVTEGLLERLDRSELEGVLAHELSHIGNYDMLLSTAVVVLVGFISILSDMFLRSMFWGGRDRDDRGGGQAQAILMIVGIVMAVLAPIAATLMHLAISRKREFLADASGALLTRYPEGLANALLKISKDPSPLRKASNTTAHLWFEDPFDKPGKKISWLHKLFMSHPPVEDRLRALRNLKI